MLQFYKHNKKNLLYRTGNYIQYLIITYNGKESEAVHLKLTQYCKSTIVKFLKSALFSSPELLTSLLQKKKKEKKQS